MAPSPRLANMKVKVPGPPPCKPRATKGRSDTSEEVCKKNKNTRSKMTFRRGDCHA